MHTAGVPGRQKLQSYRDCDLLSSFIAQVDKVQQPCVAVELQAGEVCKDTKKESQEAYFIRISNIVDFAVSTLLRIIINHVIDHHCAIDKVF